MAYPVIGRCPICDDALQVASLHCGSCDTTITGRFDLGRFHGLTSAQLAFAEVFIRCEGKITRVESELGLSYPTVRSRLNDLIRALGYPLREETRLSPVERRTILDRLASGEISPEEAIDLLASR